MLIIPTITTGGIPLTCPSQTNLPRRLSLVIISAAVTKFQVTAMPGVMPTAIDGMAGGSSPSRPLIKIVPTGQQIGYHLDDFESRLKIDAGKIPW